MIRPLAKDTNDAVERGLADCRNLGLILDKFQPYQPLRDDRPDDIWELIMQVEVDGRDGWQKSTRKSGEARGLWFNGPPDRKMILRQPELTPNDVPRRDGSVEKEGRIDKAALKNFRTRWQSSMKSANAELFTMWTESPLIIGLGAKGTLETAITLHPLYGFPYIPGSALKGIARAAAFFALAEKLGIEGVDNETFLKLTKTGGKTGLQKLAQALDEGEEAKWPDYLKAELQAVRHFRDLFGWRSAAGKVIFFDGVPVGVPIIVSEVMTPHFKAYYDSGDEPPHDADQPNPISLLAVARRTAFSFAVGLRRGPQDMALRQPAEDWLKSGLTELGLGGKTAAGYGFFSKSDPGPARVSVDNKSEADVSTYRRPGFDQVGGRSGGPKQIGMRPESEHTAQTANELAANLARLAAEAEAKEKARLARKEEKKKRGKK